MNIPEILVANGTGAVLVSFLLLLRVRGESKNSVGTELFCRILVVTLLAQATETISFLLDGVPGAVSRFWLYLTNTVCTGATVSVGYAWCLYVDFRVYRSIGRLRRRHFLLGAPLLALLVLLVGTGIFFTIKLHFVQLSSFADGVRHLFKGFSLHGKAADKDGMSSFQALATAIAAQVGTGNITGCATALVSGGPGALFWTWVSAFFGMATIYAEAVLAQTYRTTVDGQVTGGPAYYIRAAFKGKFGKFLAIFFSVALILALGFMGNMVQSNSIGDAFHNAFGVNRVVVGVVIAVLAAFIFLGGVKRIAAVTEKLVPIMALFYIIGCVIILVMNASAIPNAFVQIFTLAFQPQAIAGGVAGVTVQQAMRYGVARGLFSNEAGLGSTPHAHALAKVKQPQDQGALAIIGVFVDTFVILTLTALVLITSGLIPEGMTGTALTQAAFSLTFGSFGKVFIAICMLFFAFSTILGWYFFGQVNFNALFGSKYTKVYSLIVVLFILIGSSLKVDLVWALADFFNGLMAVPNLLALLALSGVVAGIARNKKD